VGPGPEHLRFNSRWGHPVGKADRTIRLMDHEDPRIVSESMVRKEDRSTEQEQRQ
jgi:hypothetical protein